MPTWRKLLGPCFSVPLVAGGSALMYDAVTSEHYLRGRYALGGRLSNRPRLNGQHRDDAQPDPDCHRVADQHSGAVAWRNRHRHRAVGQAT